MTPNTAPDAPRAGLGLFGAIVFEKGGKSERDEYNMFGVLAAQQNIFDTKRLTERTCSLRIVNYPLHPIQGTLLEIFQAQILAR